MFSLHSYKNSTHYHVIFSIETIGTTLLTFKE